MTTGEAKGTNGGPGGAAPGHPDELMAEIERTRAELGDTVDALAAKADVKARAQQRAAEVSGQLKDRVDEVKAGLTSRAGHTRQAVTERGKTVLGASQPTAQRAGQRAAQAGTSAWQAAPEPVQRGARRVARTVDEHRIPAIAIAGVTVLAGWLAIRWLRR
jgi:uncharacterized protein DUF3618